MDKIEKFAELLESDQVKGLIRHGFDPEQPAFKQNYTVRIKKGKKYTKVDVGTSGKYMVDQEGNIWGIKAYGVIHKGHHYGTLDTIHDWDWSEYYAVKIGR